MSVYERSSIELSKNSDNSRKMAVIAPLFFGYYKDIIKESENLGFKVDYFCDAPSNTNISKALSRINPRIIKKSVNKYYQTKIAPLFSENRYDVVLLVGGMSFSLTAQMIEDMRKKQHKAFFVMYQWDSEKNLPYSTHIHKFFDSIYTFDRFDKSNNSIYKFLPLFYNQSYELLGRENINKYEYDCMYVGTAHPKKFLEVNKMSECLRQIYHHQFIYHYMPSKLKYYYHKLFAPEYKKAKFSDFMTKKLSIDEIIDLLRKSRCVLDCPQGGQTGLTIRTIECLGAKKKLITVNEDIVNYDFYNPRNILVFSDNIDYSSSFFTEDYEDLPEDIYKKYSLNSWLTTMLSPII